MVYDARLHLVARAKAEDLARRGYFSHVDPDGYGPNRAVQLTGYGLPGFWGTSNSANFIESIAAGYTSAQAAFDGWMNSPGHRRHVLAEESFYAEQTRYGVGYASVPGSPYTRYYVFISAPPSTGGDTGLDPYHEWLFGNYLPAQIDTGSDSDDEDGDGLDRVSEFAFDGDPAVTDALASPVVDPASGRLEWQLAVRGDLGSVGVEVECSRDLAFWSPVGVGHSSGRYWIETGDGCGFMRVIVRRE
jgi:hypothetical protein